MIKLLVFALILTPTVHALDTGLCRRQVKGTIDCAIPDSTTEQAVQISGKLSATYVSYVRVGTSGILVKFFNRGKFMRAVNLSYNSVDSETNPQVTVDLRKKIPAGDPVIGLEFEGIETSVQLRVIYRNSENQASKVDVFSAE